MIDSALTILTSDISVGAQFVGAALYLEQPPKVLKIGLLLPLQNSQSAERLAGELGVVAARILFAGEILWRTDSREACKGAAVRAELVQGHSSDRRNNACDRASRWFAQRGERLLLGRSDGYVGGVRAQNRWFLIDCREGVAEELVTTAVLREFCAE